MGQDIIASISMDIAIFLGLQDPHLYTSNCFRRTGATLLAESEISLERGIWKSTSACEGVHSWGCCSILVPSELNVLIIISITVLIVESKQYTLVKLMNVYDYRM